MRSASLRRRKKVADVLCHPGAMDVTHIDDSLDEHAAGIIIRAFQLPDITKAFEMA
ncbi:hypothetical protein J21TS3_51290 [Paenibacillus cookii]|uniref:Uncharacterized protein n=1 Tax=Paenibacillus cookii TaxID=157839 RepID=A0ABQ4M578_9BACL|nr:hypothetical protein J21TS3_51290 [Paenibacillus cookii]